MRYIYVIPNSYLQKQLRQAERNRLREEHAAALKAERAAVRIQIGNIKHDVDIELVSREKLERGVLTQFRVAPLPEQIDKSIPHDEPNDISDPKGRRASEIERRTGRQLKETMRTMVLTAG